MNKIGLLVAAALGGAAVYWYIKRTCPCQHAADAAHAAAGAITSASSLTGTSKMQAGAVDAGDSSPITDASEDYGDAASASSTGELTFDQAGTPSTTAAGISTPASSYAGASSSSCTSCSGAGASSAPVGLSVFDAATTAIVDPLRTTVLQQAQSQADSLSFSDAATFVSVQSRATGLRGAL